MVSKKELAGDFYDSFQPEDRVKHPTFGEGQIIQRWGSGSDTKFLVSFDEEGEKKLLASYSKLKKVRPLSASADEKEE